MKNNTAKTLNLASATVLGSEIVGFAVVGVLIDYALGTLSTVPWATLVLCPVGLVVALLHLMRIVKPAPPS